MRSRLSLLAAPCAYLAALLLIWLSYSSYAAQFTPVGRWQAATNDPADYRFVAEYFWGVPFRADTYDVIWHGGWGDYLRLIPFRSIGLGSFYLIAGWLRLGHAPATPDEVLAAGIAFAYAQKVLLAAALIVLFAAMRRRWNTALALFAVAATAFPPVYWRISDDFLTEPPQRIVFLLAFACAVMLSGRNPAQDRRGSAISAYILLALWLIATHLKVQWYVGALLLLPALVIEASRETLLSRRTLGLTAAALMVPLSVMAVNWVGWRTVTLSPGFGLHVNLRYEGEVLREYSTQMASSSQPPAFAEPDRPHLRWWNIYVGPEVTRAQWEDFDDFGRQYLRHHPGSALRNLWTGIELGATVPGVQRVTQGRIRLEPLDPPWSRLMRYLDVLFWILLAVGIAFRETRVPCAMALVLWIVPAIGNVVSPYEPRYHLPMSGIAAVAAACVVVTLKNRFGSEG